MQQKVGKYVILTDQIIGQGAFGRVLRCQDNENQEKICVKVLQSEDQQWITQICGILSYLKQPHCNVLKIYDTIQVDYSTYIFMEQCDGNFAQYMQGRKAYWFGNDEIYDFLSQIVSGYMYLKQQNIIHRNIIPKNILYKTLFDKRVLYKISDFEVGKLNKGSSVMTVAGTPLYQAPEIFNNQNHYDDKCDVYSLGLILYQLCYQGQQVTEIKSMDDLKKFHQRIRDQGFRCPQGSSADKSLLELIEQMIVFNPYQRMSWYDLAGHPKLQPKFIILSGFPGYFVDFTKPLGSGMQGATFQAFNLKTQQSYCAKRIKNDQTEGLREIEIYCKIKSQPTKNENIIGIEDIVNVNNEAYLVLERCDESIEQYCKTKNFDFKEEEINDIIKQIVNGYVFLKSMGIIHRDLKPANILVKYQDRKPILKIIDYGVGKILTNSNMLATTQAGTPSYAAPEVLLGAGSYDHSCDIFSLGVMCYELVHQKPLIFATSMDELLRKLNALRTQPAKCKNSQVSQKLSSIIEQMLQYNPAERITWEKLQEIFKPKIKIVSVQQMDQNLSDSNRYNNQQGKFVTAPVNFQQANPQLPLPFIQNVPQNPEDDLFRPQIEPPLQGLSSLRGTPYPTSQQQNEQQQQSSNQINQGTIPKFPNNNINGFQNQNSPFASKKPVAPFPQPNQGTSNFQQTIGTIQQNPPKTGQPAFIPASFQFNKDSTQKQNQYGFTMQHQQESIRNPQITKQFQQQETKEISTQQFSQLNQNFQQNKPNNFQQKQSFVSNDKFTQPSSLNAPPTQINKHFSFNQTLSQPSPQQNFQFTKPALTNNFQNNFQFPNKGIQNHAITQYNIQGRLSSTTYQQAPLQLNYSYLKNLLELAKRSCDLIEQSYQTQNDNRSNHYLMVLSYLIILFRIQCIKDLIKLIENQTLTINGKQYTLSENPPDTKFDLEIEISDIIDFKNRKKQILESQKDQIIQELLKIEQDEEKLSTFPNYTFANSLKFYQQFYHKLEKEILQNQNNTKLKYAAVSMYWILIDYPLDASQELISLMLRQKSEPEKQEYIYRTSKK